MNAKKCKALRKVVRNSSQPGELLRQLVGFRQVMAIGHKGGSSIGAVNNPWTFRGRYRALKKGRIIDLTRIVERTDEKRVVSTTSTAVKSAIQSLPRQLGKTKMLDRVKKFFRRGVR